jgi:predicted PurR-regulated permease PerM
MKSTVKILLVLCGVLCLLGTIYVGIVSPYLYTVKLNSLEKISEELRNLREEDQQYIRQLEDSNTELTSKVDQSLSVAARNDELLKVQVSSYSQLIQLVKDTQQIVHDMVEELQK